MKDEIKDFLKDILFYIFAGLGIIVGIGLIIFGSAFCLVLFFKCLWWICNTIAVG